MDLRKVIWVHGIKITVKHKDETYTGELESLRTDIPRFDLRVDGKRMKSLPFTSVVELEYPNNPHIMLGKPMPKKEVSKLQPGTWIRVRYRDSEDEVAMVVKKPSYTKYDMDVEIYIPGNLPQYQHSRILHDQVLKILSLPKAPELG